MLAQIHSSESTTATQQNSLSNLDMEGPAMLPMRVYLSAQLLLQAQDVGSAWQDIARELMEANKGYASNKIRELGPYRISHRRDPRLYILEDSNRNVLRILAYGEGRSPELVVEYGKDRNGRTLWKVVYSIGGKYPEAGATMQRANNVHLVPA